METYSTQEASSLTGLSVRALRKRIERGQLRAVQHGHYWRIPRSELARQGLIGLAEGTPEGEGTEGTDNDLAPFLAELERVRTENERLTRELARLRVLPEHVERVTEDLHRERTERMTAEAKAAAEAKAVSEARNWQRRLAQAGWRERRRMLRELRQEAA